MRQYIDLVESILLESSCASLDAYFRNEKNFNIKSPPDEGAHFPSRDQWFSCDSWAFYVRLILGPRAQIWGFWGEENPTAKTLNEICDGHTFAVVDGRYIVDGWMPNVEQLSRRACFDMSDKSQEEEIIKLYGDMNCWEHMIEVEERVDHLNPALRKAWLKGVKPPPAGV